MFNPIQSPGIHSHFLTSFIFLLSLLLLPNGCADQADRSTYSLNGIWELAVRPASAPSPDTYDGTVPVPGLGDLATFSIDSFGYRTKEKRNLWYRRTFSIDAAPGDLVTLIIHKVKFGHTVYVNGTEVGGSSHCFTPGSYDISELIHHGSENELVVRVGAFYDNLAEPAIYGADFEKLKYQPGIYDDVEIIVSGDERISNVQIAPDIKGDRIQLQIRMDYAAAQELQYRITESKSGKMVKRGTLTNLEWVLQDDRESHFSLSEISLEEYKTWSPENPFLYDLELYSANDNYQTRFGMRSFRFNTEGNLAELNGDSYYMRGTNVCIFRFFEDPDRGNLPWDTAWVRNLHQKFKSMHWNSIRYCISAPPRFWYDIADEEGLLIQDEYPVWTGINIDGENGFKKRYPEVTAQSLADEYKSWMQERWNHPCIVIWDAQNESVTPITGEAIQIVRELDLSDRPWENGWATPQAPGDPMETHPYRFTKYISSKASPKGPLKEVISEPQLPDNGPSQRMPPEEGGVYLNPIIINEYGWLWLNRDGTTTTLTDNVYPNAFGEGLSTEKRLEIYGRHLGILTEYWRAHRKCAGVLHFCGLAYSRSEEPRGQTSDHFTDIKNLVFEENFVEFVKPAFNPVGVFINWFELELNTGEACEIPAIIINDFNREVKGTLTFEWITMDGNMELVYNDRIELAPFEKYEQAFTINAPPEPGPYELVLRISYDDQIVKSRRKLQVL